MSPTLRPPGERAIVMVSNRAFGLANSRLEIIAGLQDRGYHVIAAGASDLTVPKIQAAGAEWVPLSIASGGLRMADLNALRQLWWLYRTRRPRLVVHFNGKAMVLGTLAAERAGVGAVINTVTGFGNLLNNDRFRPPVRYMLRRTAERSDTVVFQNPDDLAVAVGQGVVMPRRAQVVLSSGVRTDVFKPANVNRVDGKQLRVLMVSRLLWQKGVREFVEAARRVRAHFGNVRFVLGGELVADHPDAVPDSVIREWVAEGTIEFAGYIHDMASYLSSVDVFVLPTVYREGVPRVLLEAAASCVPVITVDGAGCRHAVRDGETGYLVPAGNVEVLVDRITRLVASSELRAAFGCAGRRLMVDQFEQADISRQLLEIFEKVLYSTRAPSRQEEVV